MKKNLLAMVAVGLLAGPIAAQAIPLRLDATAADPTFFSSWYVDFNDNGDHLFELSELTFFSGISQPQFNLSWDTMAQAADIPGASIGGQVWIFTSSVNPASSLFHNGAGYSYGILEAPVSVPEPGTLALFGLGLAALGLMCRRRLS